MSKTKLLLDLVTDIRSVADDLEAICQCMADNDTESATVSADSPAQTAEAHANPPLLTLLRIHLPAETVSRPTSASIRKPERSSRWICPRYEQGERPLLDDETEALAKAAQREAMETDDREGLVLEYLDKLLPEDWARMDLNARRGFLRNDPFNGGDKEGAVKRKSVCVMEVWAECFGRDPGAIKKTDRNEILSILAKLGWKNGAAIAQRTAYGVQKCFSRPDGINT
ncbi:MAG: hypothetical protein IKP72_06960 [Clostridia bacterium]|nr:hypothetical protein [Clostridia bacterium]